MSVPPDQIPPTPPPTPPPASTPPPYAPPYSPPREPPRVTPSSTDDRNIAMLTHLSGCILNIIVPLVVWLMNKDKPEKAYLVTESKEALNFQITVLIGYVICWILVIILIGVFLKWVLIIVNLVMCVVAAMKVSSEGSYRYPFALRLIS